MVDKSVDTRLIYCVSGTWIVESSVEYRTVVAVTGSCVCVTPSLVCVIASLVWVTYCVTVIVG